MYIYIERERERDRQTDRQTDMSLFMHEYTFTLHEII